MAICACAKSTFGSFSPPNRIPGTLVFIQSIEINLLKIRTFSFQPNQLLP
jgi:hypothetical protein